MKLLGCVCAEAFVLRRHGLRASPTFEMKVPFLDEHNVFGSIHPLRTQNELTHVLTCDTTDSRVIPIARNAITPGNTKILRNNPNGIVCVDKYRLWIQANLGGQKVDLLVRIVYLPLTVIMCPRKLVVE